MARAFEESHAAYERRDGAGAKELSNQGKAHQREMERLNAEASVWIFRGESDVFRPFTSFTLHILIPCVCETVNRKQPGRHNRNLSKSGQITEVTWHLLVFFRIVDRGRSICTDFTSRKPSHTPTRAFLKREPGAIRRFTSSLVCIKVLFPG